MLGPVAKAVWSVAKHIILDLSDRNLHLLMSVSAVLLFLSFQVGLSTLSPQIIDVGDQTDEGYVRGFHQRESNEWSSFRWTKADSYVVLADVGHIPMTVSLALNGWRPEDQPVPQVVLLANGREMANFVAGGELRTYQFRHVPPVLPPSRNVVLEIRSEVFAPTTDQAGRTLGVLVDSVVATPIAEPLWSFYLVLVLLLSLAIGMGYLALRSLGGGSWFSFLGGLLLLTPACSLLAVCPLRAVAFSIWFLGFCAVSYVSGLIVHLKGYGDVVGRLGTRVLTGLQSARGRTELLHLISRIAVLLAVAGVLRVGLTESWRYVVSELGFMRENPYLTYEEKMRSKWGVWYDYMVFVRDSTPPDALIMIPPQTLWEWSGNGQLVSFFTYPRRLTLENRAAAATDQTVSHLLMAHDGGRDWPEFAVPAERILYMPQRRQVWVDDFVVKTAYGVVMLEDFEGSTPFTRWASNARKVVANPPLIVDARTADTRRLYFDLTYTQTEYDYWGRAVDIALNEPVSIEASVRSNLPHRVNLVAEVRYPSGNSAVFGSPPNTESARWEVLGIEDLYSRASDFGMHNGWRVVGMKLTMIGINTGCQASMPYQEGWGVIELDKGAQGPEQATGWDANNAQHHMRLARAYEVRSDVARAIEEYQSALELEPSNWWPHFGLGEVYLAQQEIVLAVASYERAIELEPDIGWVHFRLGEAYQAGGETERAVAEYQAVIEIEPDAAWGYLALASVRETQGELDRAYELYSRAGELAFDSTADAVAAKEGIARLGKEG